MRKWRGGGGRWVGGLGYFVITESDDALRIDVGGVIHLIIKQKA